MSQILSYLPLLACPAGMALMMLMMRRPSGPPRSADDTRIAQLEREIELLRAEGSRKDEAASLDRASYSGADHRAGGRDALHSGLVDGHLFSYGRLSERKLRRHLERGLQSPPAPEQPSSSSGINRSSR